MNDARLEHLNRISLWTPTVTMMLMSLISYIDRNTLALLAPTILKEAGLNQEQYGFIISAFSIAYMLGNPVWGHWLDRFGLRRGLIASVSFWTVASAAHAVASGFWSFALARCTLGFGEGATFPGGLRTVVQTLPPESRSRGVAVAYSGGSLGAVLTPLIVTPIALHWGWRGAFWFTGFAGIAWLVLWGFVSRSVPGVAPTAHSSVDAPRIGDPRLWSFICAYGLGALPLAFVLYNGALYLSRALGKTQLEIGSVLWIPPLGWEAGYFFWGWITDRWLKSSLSPRASYKRLFTILVFLSLPLALTTHIGAYGLALFELFFAMFVAAGFVIGAVSYATSVYSPHHSGLIAGIGAGSWSAAVALVMPVMGRMFDRHRYEEAFWLATAFPVLGYCAWYWLSLRGERFRNS